MGNCNQSQQNSGKSSSNISSSTKKEWKGVQKGAQLQVKDKFTSSLTGIIIFFFIVIIIVNAII